MTQMNSLKDLYVDQLQDNYSANKQMAGVVGEFLNVARDEQLKSMLGATRDKIAQHNETLKSIITGHGADPDGEHCKGMEGLVREGRAHGLEAEFGEESVQDAAIITQVQRMSHYGLAAYGTCQAMARQLGMDEDAEKLEMGLDEIYEGDAYLTLIAEQRVNPSAAN